MNNICGECFHYKQGEIENPCQRGNKFCGYLIENKPCWEEREGESGFNGTTKVCINCGKELPVKMFYKTKHTEDNLTPICKLCKPYQYYRNKNYGKN